LTTSGPSYWAT